MHDGTRRFPPIATHAVAGAHAARALSNDVAVSGEGASLPAYLYQYASYLYVVARVHAVLCVVCAAVGVWCAVCCVCVCCSTMRTPGVRLC